MKATNPWITYRTRFLVKAQQLTTSLHRSSRPATLRTQGRLSCRIERRRSQHRAPADLRGYLRAFASRPDSSSGRDFRAARHSPIRNSDPGRNLPAVWDPAPARDSHALAPASPHPQVSPTLSRPPQSDPRPSLSLDRLHRSWRNRRWSSRRPEWWDRLFSARQTAGDRPTGNWQLAASNCCGKPIWHARTKPAIAGDTTCGVSLLTDTITGSKFAIP